MSCVDKAAADAYNEAKGDSQSDPILAYLFSGVEHGSIAVTIQGLPGLNTEGGCKDCYGFDKENSAAFIRVLPNHDLATAVTLVDEMGHVWAHDYIKKYKV